MQGRDSAEYNHQGSHKSKGETEGPEPEKACVMAEAEVRAMVLLAVKVQGGAISHRTCVAREFGIGKRTESSLQPPERTQHSRHLQFGP